LSTLDKIKQAVYDFLNESDYTDLLNTRIRNQETGRDIKVKSALGYDPSHPVHQVAVNLIKKRQPKQAAKIINKVKSDNKSDKNTNKTADNKPTGISHNSPQKSNSYSDIKIDDAGKKQISNALSLAKKNLQKYSDKPEVRNQIKSFIEDFTKWSEKPTAANAKTLEKYQLTKSRDAEAGEKSKIYIGSIKDRQGRKIFGDSNTATAIADMFTQAGILSKNARIEKKQLTPNKVFPNSVRPKVTISEKHVMIGNTKIAKPPVHSKKEWEDWYSTKKNKDGKTFTKDEVKRKTEARLIKQKLDEERYNNFLENVKDPEFKILDVGDASTDKGRHEVKQKTLNSLTSIINNISKNGDLTPETKKLVNQIDSIKKLKPTDVEEFNNQMNSLIFNIGNNPQTTKSVADFVEIASFLRHINMGHNVILPASSNFKLADMIIINDGKKKGPTPLTVDYINEKDSDGSLISSTSIKYGVGGASASKSKIEYSIFKNVGSNNTQSDLLKINDQFVNLFNKGEYKESDALIKKLSNDYSDILKKDPEYNKRLKDNDGWIKRNNIPPKLVDAYKRYLILGYMMQSIHNELLQGQCFNNEKFTANKSGVTVHTTDGEQTVSYMKFNPSLKLPNGYPTNTFPSNMVNAPNKNYLKESLKKLKKILESKNIKELKVGEHYTLSDDFIMALRDEHPEMAVGANYGWLVSIDGDDMVTMNIPNKGIVPDPDIKVPTKYIIYKDKPNTLM
jgi:hypothetical protein